MNAKKLFRVVVPLVLVSMQAFTNIAADEPAIDLSLYPPLSSGEASPWESPGTEPEKADSSAVPNSNPWSAQQAPLVAQPYGNLQPQYRNQGQYQYPYPQQGAYPNQGMVPFYPQMPQMTPMPYGYNVPNNGLGYFPPNGWNNSGPFNSGPFNNMPFNNMPFNNMPFNNSGPSGFSMPWPF